MEMWPGVGPDAPREGNSHSCDGESSSIRFHRLWQTLESTLTTHHSISLSHTHTHIHTNKHMHNVRFCTCMRVSCLHEDNEIDASYNFCKKTFFWRSEDRGVWSWMQPQLFCCILQEFMCYPRRQLLSLLSRNCFKTNESTEICCCGPVWGPQVKWL